MLRYVRTKAVLDEWGEDVTQEAKRNLGARTTRRGVRSKWDGMSPIRPKFKMFRANYIATSYLWDNIFYEHDLSNMNWNNLQLIWEMPFYGEYVDEGRDAGKWPNPDEIKKWIRERNMPISREVLEYSPEKKKMVGTGKYKFAKRKNYMYNQLTFLMARKIKFFGIDGSGFFSEPFLKSIDKYSDTLVEAIVADVIEEVQPTIS